MMSFFGLFKSVFKLLTGYFSVLGVIGCSKRETFKYFIYKITQLQQARQFEKVDL